MDYPKNGWLGMGIQVAIVTFVVAVVALGCASSQAPVGTDTSSMVQTIGNVSVGRDGDDSVVRLSGLVDPVYSLTTPDGENKVVVDLVGVDRPSAENLMGAVPGEDQQIAAYDGIVDLVTLSTFEDGGAPLTRVEITLADSGSAEIVSESDGLEIRVRLGEVDGGEETFGQLDAADDFAMEADPSMDVVIEDTNAGGITADDWAAGADLASDEGSVEATPWQAVEENADDEAARAAFETGADSFDDAAGAADGGFAGVTEAFGEVEAPPAAKQLTGVTTQTTDMGVLVGLQADGAVEAIEAFTLESPARLVIDLPGLSAGRGARDVTVASDWVKGVRVGGHADKVRIVVDGGAKAQDFQGRQIMPGTTGLWVAIGEGDALANAMVDALAGDAAAWQTSASSQAKSVSPSLAQADTVGESDFGLVVTGDEVAQGVASEQAFAPAESDAAAFEAVVDTISPELAETAGLAEVYGLHYERTDGLDRTAILSDEAVQYSTSAVDPTTLVVQIHGARISEEASDRIFPAPGGPVSLIHAFQQPEVSVPEVRVVFTRAPNQEPVVSRRGSMLFIDFADQGVAAAPPPAFPNAGQAGAVAASQVAATPATAFDDPMPGAAPAAAIDGFPPTVADAADQLPPAIVDTPVAGSRPGRR